MQIAEIMSQPVHTTQPDHTVKEAATLMGQADLGALPVEDGDELVGMLTDRDLALRIVAQGLSSETTVGEAMSSEVLYCFDDDELETVAQNMADIQVHRLPVVNRDKRLVGIVALADIARVGGVEPAGVAVAGISDPTPQHSQSA